MAVYLHNEFIENKTILLQNFCIIRKPSGIEQRDEIMN